jgi:hypothetical protein
LKTQAENFNAFEDQAARRRRRPDWLAAASLA